MSDFEKYTAKKNFLKWKETKRTKRINQRLENKIHEEWLKELGLVSQEKIAGKDDYCLHIHKSLAKMTKNKLFSMFMERLEVMGLNCNTEELFDIKVIFSIKIMIENW